MAPPSPWQARTGAPHRHGLGITFISDGSRYDKAVVLRLRDSTSTFSFCARLIEIKAMGVEHLVVLVL